MNNRIKLSLLRKVIDSSDSFQVERMGKMLFRTTDPSLVQKGGEGAAGHSPLAPAGVSSSKGNEITFCDKLQLLVNSLFGVDSTLNYRCSRRISILQNCACILLFASTLQGQSLDTLRFPFIKYEKNVLAFPGGTQNFEPFYHKVQEHFLEGTGAVNIMHIGGSHVQAGIWTEAIWKTIETRFPDASVTRGLIFPYRAIGTTQPGDYLVNFGGSWHGCRNVQRARGCSLGVMGISASTQDSGAFLMITHRPDRGKTMRFRRLKIFHHDDAETFDMSFRNDSLAVLCRDSTDSYTLVEFSRVIDTLYLQLNKTDSLQRSFSLYGFRIESDESGLCFDVIGNNGADLPSYLKCDLFEQQLRAAVPDVVILSVGINDAYTRHFNAEQYKTNYRELISRIRASAPDCAILFTTNNDSYYRKRYPNHNGAKVQKAIFELAEEYDAGVWDLYEVMGGHRSINQWVAAKLARTDRIHFTSGGYHVIGTLLSDALMNAFLEFHSQHLPGD